MKKSISFWIFSLGIFTLFTLGYFTEDIEYTHPENTMEMPMYTITHIDYSHTESTSTVESVGTTSTSSIEHTPTSTVASIPKNPPVIAVPETPKKPVVSLPTNHKPTKWGVFTGSNPNTIADFEKRVTENPDYLAYFVHWGNGGGKLPSYLKKSAYEKDRTLIVFWEASDYIIGGTDQPEYSYRNILAGNWDTYFQDFAQQLALYEGPVILVPFSELNGNWTPWSGTKNGNTPAEAVQAYQYVHGFFAKNKNVSFGWAVNAASVPNTPENQIEHYYPGDAYVDYVGVDGFNMGSPWLSFDALFGQALSKLNTYAKPVLIFSFASAEGAQKSAWLHDALNVQLPKHPSVVGWIYFNQNKERNWLLWSDEATFDVFNEYISR